MSEPLTIFDEVIEYRAGIHKGMCRVRVYPAMGYHVVVLSQLEGWDGISITNSMECAVREAKRKFNLEHYPIYWIEHWPAAASPDGVDTFDHVNAPEWAPVWKRVPYEWLANEIPADIAEDLLADAQLRRAVV